MGRMVKGLVHSVHERRRIQTAVLLYLYHFLFLIVCGIQIWLREAWEIWSRVCVCVMVVGQRVDRCGWCLMKELRPFLVYAHCK